MFSGGLGRADRREGVVSAAREEADRVAAAREKAAGEFDERLEKGEKKKFSELTESALSERTDVVDAEQGLRKDVSVYKETRAENRQDISTDRDKQLFELGSQINTAPKRKETEKNYAFSL